MKQDNNSLNIRRSQTILSVFLKYLPGWRFLLSYLKQNTSDHSIYIPYLQSYENFGHFILITEPWNILNTIHLCLLSLLGCWTLSLNHRTLYWSIPSTDTQATTVLPEALVTYLNKVHILAPLRLFKPFQNNLEN